MHSEPFISVVIPCYNAERYLSATIASVLAQQQASLEIIVVDDGSRDGSVALLQQEFPNVRLLQQSNAGIAAARNAGIAAARGTWVAFVDADDSWLPGKLAVQLALLAVTPGCRMSYTAWQEWHSEEPAPDPQELADFNALAGQQGLWDGASGWIYPQLLEGSMVWTSSVVMQRSLLNELGGFDSNLAIGEDYDLWLRASRLTTIVRVARPYALYRRHPASITRAVPDQNYQARVVQLALARWGMASPDGRQANPAAVRSALAKSWSDYAGEHLVVGNVAQARAGGWAALRTSARHVPGWKVLIKACAFSLIKPTAGVRT